VLTRDDILRKLSLVKEDAAALGFVELGLFGSIAQNRQSALSDIDVAVYSNRNITGGGFEYLEKLDTLNQKLYKIFRRPIDIYDLNRKKETNITKAIKKEVIYV